MDLTHDDVLEILNIIENSSFDVLELEMGDLRLTVRKSGASEEGATMVTREAPKAAPQPPPAPAPSAAAPGETTQTTPQAPSAGQAAPEPPKQGADTPSREGLVAVEAPMVGTFYAQPEPGAPPFVTVGSAVDEDTTLGLIEVMKVFNSIKCGVEGVIAEILVENGQFVEYGQDLFLVRPEASASSPEQLAGSGRSA